MSQDSEDRTASLMTPAKLAQLMDRPKAPASPSAYLDQLAADAGSGHAMRLVDLRQQLEAQVRERAYDELQATLDRLQEDAEKLDFDRLEPKGWLARATGKGKEEAAGFVAQYERIGRGGEDLQDEVRAVQKQQQAQAAVVERTLRELGVETRALEKIIDQGARWLQDMRGQLKEREALGGDAAAQKLIGDDAARCELLVARLKLLRAASSAAQQATERCQASAGRRAGVLESLQQALDGEWKVWRERLAPVGNAARSNGVAKDGVAAARAAHAELQASMKQAASDCRQLQEQEQALADELAGLHASLQAAA